MHFFVRYKFKIYAIEIFNSWLLPKPKFWRFQLQSWIKATLGKESQVSPYFAIIIMCNSDLLLLSSVLFGKNMTYIKNLYIKWYQL